MNERHCEMCGALLERKRYPSGGLETPRQFAQRRFCDQRCMGRAMVTDTPTLAAARWRSRRMKGDACEACGAATNLVIHHRDENPFNNASSNLMTLCARCHKRHHRGLARLAGSPPLDPAKVATISPRCVCEHVKTRHYLWRHEQAGGCRDCDCAKFAEARNEAAA